MQHSDLNNTFARMAEAMRQEQGAAPDRAARNLSDWNRTFTDAPRLRERAQGVLDVVRARINEVAAPSEPPPEIPDLQEVLAKAQQTAQKIGRIRAGLQIGREAIIMYRDALRGQPITGRKVWGAFRRVSRASTRSASAAWRRSIHIVALDTAARVIAWRTADAAREQVIARAIHGVSKRLAGRAAYALTAVDTFKVMHRDIKRYNTGELSQDDFYINCALTGVSLAAPVAGSAIAGPPGATVGLVVSMGAGMLKR
ncbi:MAG: hypothetical protein CMH57_15685 [Myxococcales bacterium]|nr:hypothetical protein [Myxococcales bacterium]